MDGPYCGLRMPREEIAFILRPKIQSQSQIFRYGRSIFCLPHRPNFSDIFDLCLHWMSLVGGPYHFSSLFLIDNGPSTKIHVSILIPVARTCFMKLLHENSLEKAIKENYANYSPKLCQSEAQFCRNPPSHQFLCFLFSLCPHHSNGFSEPEMQSCQEVVGPVPEAFSCLI